VSLYVASQTHGAELNGEVEEEGHECDERRSFPARDGRLDRAPDVSSMVSGHWPGSGGGDRGARGGRVAGVVEGSKRGGG
jgi:hypothetical protein